MSGRVLVPNMLGIHQAVAVKLTELGRQVFIDEQAKLGSQRPLSEHLLSGKTDEYGWSRFRLSELMETFGAVMRDDGVRTSELFDSDIKILQS